MFTLSYTLSAFHLRKVRPITLKQLSAKRCPKVIELLCKAETEGTKPDESTDSD